MFMVGGTGMSERQSLRCWRAQGLTMEDSPHVPVGLLLTTCGHSDVGLAMPWYPNLAAEPMKGPHSPVHMGCQQPVGSFGIFSTQEKTDHKCKDI